MKLIILNFYKELFEDKKLFDLSLISKFRDPEYENDEEVKYAWFVYCYEIMRCVSLNWKKHTSAHTIKNRPKLDRVITLSDEAFGRFVLNVKVPEYFTSKETGIPAKKKKGPQDTKVKMQCYSIIYAEVKKSRQDKKIMKKWNSIFWEQVDIHCQKELNKICVQNNLRLDSIVTSERVELPTRDDIDEEDPY